VDVNRHQYIDRRTRRVCTERLLGDRIVKALYGDALERPQWLCELASSARLCESLAYLNYDNLIGARALGTLKFMRECGVDFSECLVDYAEFDTPRKVFERQIRYWECRPMPDDESAIVSPADSRALLGCLRHTSSLFIKDKFFDFEELMGEDRSEWLKAFAGGDYAIFRLTPEKYHYTHVPAAGEVVDRYEVAGRYYSCNPAALVSLVTPQSKNKRVVTILQTDVPGGAGVGLIAMIEVVALMVGQIVECYSEAQYASPQSINRGMHLKRGQPKSLFRPGSSTVILLFQLGRTRFADDLLRNQRRLGISSRYSEGLGQTLVETDVRVRSLVALPADRCFPFEKEYE
jgi:phosphatidylserine decarboxylase